MSKAKKGKPSEQEIEDKSLQYTQPFSESEELTPQETQELGKEAAELLSSPVMNRAYQMMVQNLVNQWLESEVDQKELRESLYHRARDLSQTVEMLGVMMNDAQQLNLSPQEKAEEDLNHYDELQGFGLQDLPH